jgi:hypothetical protein
VDNAGRWHTVDCERTVLLVARTLTSATRVLEVLDLLRGDFRIGYLFAVDEGTRSGAGVPEFLRERGVRRIVPWSRLPELHYDLAIAASEQVDLDLITSRIVVLPHGLGFHKVVPEPDGSGLRLAGLPPAAALRTGRVRLVLSHPDQQAQLVATNPDVAGQTVVTGDPTFDRLRASLPLREQYRRSVHADGRTVVLVSSTWSSESALGRWRELPRRLLAELPADEYRVCAALHPNIWDWHEPIVVRTWLADCLDAGLHLVPATQGWQAALLAADLVVGDHGSVTLLAAALGTPVLLAAVGAEVVPGTPVDELARIAARLDPREDLRGQVDKAIAAHDPRRFTAVTDRVLAHTGEATQRLRDLLYRELSLAPPTRQPPLYRFPEAETDAQPATAFDVYAAYTDPATVTLLRYPRPVHDPADQFPGLSRHLAVDARTDEPRLLQSAAVITNRIPDVNWLHRFPGARVTAIATPDGCVASVRGLGQVTVDAAGTDPMILASAVYCALLAGRLTPGRLTIRAGIDIEAHIAIP